MRKIPASLVAVKGIPPGVYLVDLSDGVAPSSSTEITLLDAGWVLEKAENGAGAGEGGGANFNGLAEKIAPAIASLAMRFM